MKEVLFLCHRIPYPPNKGDKIRAWHLLRALAEKFTVHLGTFVDDPDDWQYCQPLDELCAETIYRPLSPVEARLRSLTGLASGEPLSFPYYRDRQLQQWVDHLVRERPVDTIVMFSSTMGPYARHYTQLRRVIDFVDVDSEKWRQYAPTAQILTRWIYAREGRKLLAAERSLAASFDASVFVSAAEAQLFNERAPECAKRTIAVPNGVDSAYFDPAGSYPDPYKGSGEKTLVFTGAMDYRANVDAVTWFVDRMFPLIRKEQPDVDFCIVGANPAREVLALAQVPGVRVTGTVPDVRPYLAHAVLAVAPLRIARGLQNKVLEALSMGKRVVMTPEAATGLKPLNSKWAAVESEPRAFAKRTTQFMTLHVGVHECAKTTPKTSSETNSQTPKPATTPRDYILQHYCWDTQLARFLTLLEGIGPAPGTTLPGPAALTGDSA